MKEIIQGAYKVISKENKYITLEDVERFYNDLIKDIEDRNIICHIDVSRSGMSRKVGFYKHNLIINAIYNDKCSQDEVKVGGVGMDMVWHVLHYCTGNREDLNGKCSDYHTI